MIKAIWSKIYIDETDKASASLFYECVSDLLENDMIAKLDNFTQHKGTSRLQHSINVAYYSFMICRKLGLDYRSAARGGIMHDLFLYDWREESKSARVHISAHPKAAFENAKKITALNKIEADAILKHMWPMTPQPPRFLEGYIVSFADTFCACAEVIDGYKNRVARALSLANG